MKILDELERLEKRANESAEAMKYESDSNMCALYLTNIVKFNKAVDKAVRSLLAVCRAAETIDAGEEIAVTEGHATIQIDLIDWLAFKDALAKLEAVQP